MKEKKLSEFLKENGAYEAFIENCLKDRDTLQFMEDYNLSIIEISKGFTWAETSEGKDYWSKRYDKSCELNIIYDMNEILYKEYKKRNMKESSEQNPIAKDIVENGEEDKAEDTKQEFQTITLNGIEYNLIPKEISVGYIMNWYDKDMKAETTEEYLKRKFEEDKGQYEVLFKEKKSNDWSFCYRPNDLSWRKDWEYKLIKKEHKEIIEAYLKDRNIKIEFTNNVSKDADIETIWYIEEALIENYNEEYTYRIAIQKFEPFTLNIEINTIDEAKSLWNRFNLGYDSLCEAIQGKYYKVESINRLNTHKYWKQIGKILNDLEWN